MGDGHRLRQAFGFPVLGQQLPRRLGFSGGSMIARNVKVRSPYRPNPVAMTTCKLLGSDEQAGVVRVAGLDASPTSFLLPSSLP